MEKNGKEKDPVYCQCGNCQSGWHSHHRFFLLRWILGIIILLMVFALGLKVGEFKGYFDTNFGYQDHHDLLRQMPYYQTSVPSTSSTGSGSTGSTAKTK